MQFDSGSDKTVNVDLEPVGRRIDVAYGSTILEAAQLSGVELVATCGGVGACDSCRVQLLQGELSRPTITEQEELTEGQLEAGFRLACQSDFLSDVRISIPATSLATPQRLQLEGLRTHLVVDPPLSSFQAQLKPPSMHDLRADDTRINTELDRQGVTVTSMSRIALSEAAEKLRKQNWAAQFVLRTSDDVTMSPTIRESHNDGGVVGGELVATLSGDATLLGVAFDVGTTKVAGYLVDLDTGTILARSGVTNPQIAFGEDVVSRIAYANGHTDHPGILQAKLVEALNGLIHELCAEAVAERGNIVEVVAVGNTTMHHLLAGLPVRQLGESPYVPVTAGPLSIRASDIGLHVAPAAYLYLPPNIAGYVGSDHVAMLLASDSFETGETIVCLDIGTNTEITLVSDGQMLTCSCASGPAFEGAHIHDGMRASRGAIEHVHFHEGEFQIHTIGDIRPVGICGSGILDAVASLRTADVINDRGGFRPGHPRVRGGNGPTEFVLVNSDDSGHASDIVVMRSDINEIQLAKGAIKAGIDLLLNDAGIEAADVDRFVVAGAFGTYLRIASAIQIGLFPDVPEDKFQQVGNAAGMGAIQMLLSKERRRLAIELPGKIQYIELTNHARFHDTFVDALFL